MRGEASTETAKCHALFRANTRLLEGRSICLDRQLGLKKTNSRVCGLYSPAYCGNQFLIRDFWVKHEQQVLAEIEGVAFGYAANHLECKFPPQCLHPEITRNRNEY